MNVKLTCLLAPWLFTVILHGAPAADYPPRMSDQDVREELGAAPVAHPRLLASAEDFRSLRTQVARGPRLRKISAVVIRDAAQLLEAAPLERKLQGRRLLGESRRAVQRVLTPAMALHLTQERACADRAAREMLAAAAFSDWNSSHFLDTAEMTFALAIGYDWLHAQLEPADRALDLAVILTPGTRRPDGVAPALLKPPSEWRAVR